MVGISGPRTHTSGIGPRPDIYQQRLRTVLSTFLHAKIQKKFGATPLRRDFGMREKILEM
jgi:hypothetical protein